MNVHAENKKLYKNILVSLLVSVVLTLLISSTWLLMNFERVALRLVSETDVDSLRQSSKEVANLSDTLKTLSFQVYRDPSISKLFFPIQDIYDVTLAMQQLDNYRLSLPYIESIYVYNASSEIFYISSNSHRNGTQTKQELDDFGIIQVINNIGEYRPYTPIPRTYMIGSGTEASSYSYLSFNVLEEDLTSAIVVNISESWVNQDFDGTNQDSSGRSFIIDQHGVLLSRNDNDPMLTDYSSKNYIQKIVEDQSNNNYFVDLVDGIKSLISYTAPDTLGWRYVRTTPYADITHEITEMRTNTIFFSLSLLVLGLLISIAASYKLYGPIDKVLHRLKALETEQRNNLQVIKQDYLRNIILGRQSYTPEILQQKLSSFGSSIEMNHHSQLILLKIDRYSECIDRYRGDVRLVKYAIMNICTEIGSASFHAEAIDMGEDCVALLISVKDSSRLVQGNAMLDSLKDIQAAILHHLKLSVSITISPVKSSVDQSINIYKQLLEASLHRLFYGHGCFIHSEDIMNLKSKEYIVPVNRGKQLADCLMAGKTDEAKAIYSEVVQTTAEYPFTVFQLTLSHTMFIVANTINTIRKNNALDVEDDFDSSLVSLNHVETLEEINAHFFRIFDEISEKLDEKRNAKHNDLVKKINVIINRDYSNPSLCLNSIADELTMSPIYISRLYKQLTNYSLTEVIQEVRMNESKHLLLNSDDSVAEIAIKTGFSNSSYFYRLFKKSNGVTPNEFRKSAASSGT